MSKVELVNDYILECAPLLDKIAESIFTLNADPTNETLDVIFRAFHTIKSNSSIIEKPELGDLCHVCEDALAKVRDAGKKPNAELVSSLMQAIDFLNDSFIRLDADIDLMPIDSTILFKLANFAE